MRILGSILFLILFVGIGTPALADVARISTGGAVHQMRGGGTVSMESEIVKIKISEHLQEIDCTFNFKNKGPACSVRVGFPDFTNIPNLTNEETATNIKPTFLSYHWYVDGKESSSELVPAENDYGGNDDIKLWHASDVQFPANSKITVRACYSQLPDLSPTDMQEPIQQFIKVTRYILQTAASWKGAVKKADIYVTFDKDVAAAPIKLVSVRHLMNSKVKSSKSWWSQQSANTVCYSASVRPSVNGQELHFTLNNLRPTEKDDLLFLYQPMSVGKANDYTHYSDRVLSERKTVGVQVSTPWVFRNAKPNSTHKN
ncbi:MAG: hypothetical protein WCT03_19570 [Candidatus Obscuribacterales bacterium]|jgi:hypothetical protein